MKSLYVSIASVGFLVLGSAAGCSSANPPDDGAGGTTATGTAGTGVVGQAGTTVAPMGGTTSIGTAGSGTATAGTDAATAGTAATTGGAGTAGTGTTTGGAATGGATTGGTATTAGGASSAACKGIKSNMACTPEGQECPGLSCGLADTGTRSCKCATNWTCSSCDYTSSPFKDKPADAPTCTTEADKLPCTTSGAVCTGAAGGEVCACYPDDEGALIWDCDKPPTTWAAQ